MTMRRVLVACAAAGVLMMSALTARADNEKGTAVIKGVAKLEGEAPKAKTIPVTQDPVCQQAHPNGIKPQGATVFGDGTLPYVFVYVKKGLTGKYDVPKAPITIDQNTCMYKPHVQGMVVGQSIKILNSDPTTHNIHAKPKKNEEFNFSQTKKGLETIRKDKDTFNKPEIMVEIKCDVHPWMSAFVGVCEHPFFSTTGKGGTFEIKELPAGTYTIEAWHEMWGKMEQEVTIKDGETNEIEFKFAKKKAEAPVKADGKVVAGAAVSGGSECCAKSAAVAAGK